MTIAWLLLVEWVAFQPSTETSYLTKFDEFVQLKPSEMGDTLAGVFAVLAFVWIIVTVFLQSHELKEQRNEFREQRKATQAMAESIAKQALIFETEQRERLEDRTELELNSLLANTRKLIEELSEYDDLVKWVFQFGTYYSTSGATILSFTKYEGIQNDDDFFYLLYDLIVKKLFPEDRDSRRNYEEIIDLDGLLQVHDRLSDLIGIAPRLSVAQQTRLDTLRIEALADILGEISSEPDKVLKVNSTKAEKTS